MKYAFAPVVFGLGANAFVARDASQQCIQLKASGDASGVLGQLDDGQNRIGGGHPTGCYCLSNGGFTDSNGRGCILTPPTTQLQCDVGATPTTGFAVGSNGGVTYNGSGKFYACPVNDKGEYNVYSTPAPGQDKCVEISLSSAGSCGAGGAQSSMPAPAPSQPGYSAKPQPSQPAYSPKPQPSQPVYSPKPQPSQPAYSPKPQPSQPAYSPKPQPSQPAYSPKPQPSQPAYSPKPQPSQPAYSPKPQPSQPAYSPKPQPSQPAYSPKPQPSQPAYSPKPQPSQPAYSPKSQPSQPAYSPKPQPSKPAPQPSQPAYSPAPQPEQPAPSACPANTVTVIVTEQMPQPSQPAQSEQPKPQPSQPGYPEQPKPQPSQPAQPQQPKPSQPAQPAGSCPADLNGNYQYPHLIVPVDSSKPNAAGGTSYNGKVDSHTCTIFNFDIPQSYSGKTCSVVFLLPEQKDLETSSYTTSGSGQCSFSKLSGNASKQTSWSNAPSKEKDLGSYTVAPGGEYVIASGDCAAGQTVTYEMCSGGDFALDYFQDYNPSPIGMYVRQC